MSYNRFVIENLILVECSPVFHWACVFYWTSLESCFSISVELLCIGIIGVAYVVICSLEVLLFFLDYAWFPAAFIDFPVIYPAVHLRCTTKKAFAKIHLIVWSAMKRGTMGAGGWVLPYMPRKIYLLFVLPSSACCCIPGQDIDRDIHIYININIYIYIYISSACFWGCISQQFVFWKLWSTMTNISVHSVPST